MKSMTGFATGILETQTGSLRMELRTVNHRYLELQFRLADVLRSHEPRLREILGASLKRGKVDCLIEWESREIPGTELAPSTPVLEQLRLAAALVQEMFPEAAPLTLADVLRWPGVIPPSLSLPPDEETVLTLVRETLTHLTDCRAREGEKLVLFLAQHVADMKALIAPLAEQLPSWMHAYQDKVAQRWRETVGTVDEERLLQEMALWATKADVAEELSRLGVHLDEVERILGLGGTAGKRLDFLMQELHREANTLGSKSVDARSTNAAVELKVLIEQMREQVQNIE